jgi:UbiD family decarboxylase
MSESHIHDLQAIIDDLDAMGRLIRVKGQVHLRYDLAGIAAKYEGGPRAVLFERIHGRDYPVFTGLYWSRDMLGAVMRKDEAALPKYVSDCIKQWQAKPKPPKVVKNGPVLEVTEPDVDLNKLPIPIHAIKDGGPYFDAAVVIAKDPETGVRNASIQRFMVVDADRMNVNIDAGRHLEVYLEKAARMGKTLPFTLNIGCGPGLHFAAATPAEAAPIDTDELGIASAFHGKALQLVPGTVSDVEMVAHAMWALECEIIPGEVDLEGPFAEVTGYYAHVDKRPVVHVRKVHRREKPVFQTILSGIEVWNSVGLLGEANVLATLQKQVPGVRDVYFTHGGGGFYHAVVQIDQKMPGWTKQAIMATFAAFPPLKMVTVVDCDVDIRNPMDVEWAMTERLDAARDIHVIENVFGHGLNPTFAGYIGAKVGFDATRPFPYTPEWDRSTYKSVDLSEWRIEVPEIREPSEPVEEVAAVPAPQPAAGNGKDAAPPMTVFGPEGPEEASGKKKKKKKKKGRRGNGLPDLSGKIDGDLEAHVAAVLADWLARSEERK